jgi:carboxyl-terminal processing protease
MSRKISLGLALFLIVTAVTASFAVTMTFSQRIYNRLITALPERTAMYAEVAELDELVRAEYYGTVDQRTVNATMADGYIRGLNDPSSFYLTPPAYLAYSDRLEGRVVGVGLTAVFTPETGQVRVTEVSPLSPAANAGMKKGDVIEKIDDDTLTVSNFEEPLAKLTGRRLSNVNVTYRRGESVKTVNLTVGYDTQSVYYELIGETGYIRFSGFYKNTAAQFTKAVDELKKDGAKNLVYDVRSVADGNMEYAAAVADKIVPLAIEGTKAIATAVKEDGSIWTVVSSDAQDLTIPGVVLINRRTSGPAELFACSLRDFHRAWLIGDKTAGVGKWQHAFRLKDGSAVVLAVALVKPYTSEAFDGKGLTPDTEVTLTAEQELNLNLLPIEDDLQLQAALQHLAEEKRG